MMRTTTNNSINVNAFTSKTTDKNYYFGCQGFGGNSGGGMFDNEGNLMAIVTLGEAALGSEHHAKIIGSVSVLQPKETKIEKVKTVLKNVF